MLSMAKAKADDLKDVDDERSIKSASIVILGHSTPKENMGNEVGDELPLLIS